MQTGMIAQPIRVSKFLAVLLLLTALSSTSLAARIIVGDYAGEMRETAKRSDGNTHVDTPAMISRLTALKINTYFFLILHSPSDWDDFRNEFAPAAAKAGIDVWVYLVPPLECQPACSQPYGKDYVRWATEIARLSLQQPAVKGMVIDDFDYNGATFTPQYANQIHQAAKSVNPRFLFYPLLYWGLGLTSPGYFDRYAQAIDGFIFAYRDEPVTNTVSTESVNDQLAAVEAKSATYGKPFLLMVYCVPVLRGVPAPTAEYIQALVAAGLQAARQGKAQGVLTYVLDKYSSPLGASANPAEHGNGYGLVMVAGKTSPGAYGELNTGMGFQPGLPSYALTFWHRNVAPTGIPHGALSMQVIADHTVLWEADATGGSTTWKSETVQIPAAVVGGSSHTLRFVLTNVSGADSHFTAFFDNLQPQGFSVKDPDFENPGAWTSYRDNAAFRSIVQVFDQNQPQHLFANLSNMYQNVR
ncbi:MAG: hypothetical protein ACLPH3_02525 [Terracidiphilus sp.]